MLGIKLTIMLALASLEIEASYGNNEHLYLVGAISLVILVPSLVYVFSRMKTQSRRSASKYTLTSALFLAFLVFGFIAYIINKGLSH